jgi:hypothetical protein
MTELRSRRCETCAWWCRQMPVIAAATRDAAQRPDLGSCQVNPPVPLTGRDRYAAEWPQTHASRFCGAWTPDLGGADPDDGERISTVVPLRMAAA